MKLIISSMQMDSKLSLKIEGATKMERRAIEDLEGCEIEVIRFIPPELREDDPEAQQFNAWQIAQLDREIEVRKELKARLEVFKGEPSLLGEKE